MLIFRTLLATIYENFYSGPFLENILSAPLGEMVGLFPPCQSRWLQAGCNTAMTENEKAGHKASFIAGPVTPESDGV